MGRHHAKRWVRAGAALCLLAVALLALAACGSGGSDSGTTASSGSTAESTTADVNSGAAPDLSGVTLKIGNITGSSEIPWELAGYKTPYKVEWSNFETAGPLVSALQAGAINVAAPGITGVINAQVNGLDVKAFAEWKNPGKALMILVPKDSEITNISQLAGKKVAVTKGSAMEGLLVESLKKAGMTESDVDIVNLPASSAAAAFSSGQVDAWSISVPYSTAAEAEDGAKVLVSGAFWPQVGFFIAKPETLEDPAYSAALANFLTLYKKAVSKVTVPALASKYEAALKLPAPVATVIAENLIPGQVLPITQSTLQNYETTMKDYSSAGLVEGEPEDPQSVFTESFNKDLE